MLKIGNLEIKYRAMLAPLAALTDIAFRQLLDEIGYAGYMVTEMISADGLIRGGEKTLLMAKSFPSLIPQFIQLFGSEPQPFVEAVKYIENETGYAGIDINMGCPAAKVIKKGGGSALLKDPQRAASIVKAIKRASRLPLTVKIRLGFHEVNVFEFIKVLEGEGVDAVTVHFRLRQDGYRGTARWEYAAQIRESIETVFIGNGDIKTASEARDRLETVDGVMIGRGAVTNPLIFAQIAGGETSWDKPKILGRLLELVEEHYPGEMQLNRVKAFTRFLFSGRQYARKFRQKIYTSTTMAQAKEYISGLATGDFSGLK